MKVSRVLRLNSVEKNSTASYLLDFFRFGSALIVFLFHSNAVSVPGYQAVLLFFVLSGYFISSSVLYSISNHSWSWKSYLISRISRLWIVLIPALFLTLIWAKVQFFIFGTDKSIAPLLDLKTFIANLFFTQDIFVMQYGGDWPLWSLSYEFWYYILFPCILLIFYSKRNITKTLYVIITVAISLFVGRFIMEYFLIWLIGAVIPLARSIELRSKTAKYIITTVAFLFAISATKVLYIFIKVPNPDWVKPGIQYFADLCVGICFSLLVYIIVSFYKGKTLNKLMRISKPLAGFSYTLYLTHQPLLNIILEWRKSKYWIFSGYESLLIKVIVTFLVIFYAWFIASLTEKHTDKVREQIHNLLFRKKSNPNNNKMHTQKFSWLFCIKKIKYEMFN